LNKWFGFKQETFTQKYYSMKPFRFNRTDLFLRCNFIDKQSTFNNNIPSDILYILPVEDDQIKVQRYFSINNIKINSKLTNHFKFEITDETGKVINFRGNHVLMDFSFDSV
jgi:hypothetical protein